MSTELSKSAVPNHVLAYYVVPIGIFWLALWLAGFPPPGPDDLFFLGPSLELVRNGHLANPLLRFWNPSAVDHYFFQPPFHPYVLAGWLKLFGIGARNILGFQCAAGALASLSFSLLLHRFRFSGAWIAPVVLARTLFADGLRHEALGLALLGTGLLLLALPARPGRVLGLFLLGSSLASSPVLVVFAVPLGIALIARDGWQPQTLRWWLLAGLLSFSLLLVLFLGCIGGDLAGFLRDFLWHARVRHQSDALGELVHHLTNGYAAVLLLPVYILFLLVGSSVALRWRQVRPEAKTLLLALSAGIVSITFLYGSALPGYATPFCWMGIFALVGELPVVKRTGRLWPASILAAFVLTNSYTLIQIMATDWRATPDSAAIRAALPPGRTLSIDGVAARFVFDYRLPEKAVSWNYSTPPGEWPPSLPEKAGDTVWIVSIPGLSIVPGFPPARGAVFLGREFRSIPARPFEVLVIR
jgi:hypothetical protein